MRDDSTRDIERALRAANLAVAEVRDELHHLAAQVVALIDEVGRRLDAPVAEPPRRGERGDPAGARGIADAVDAAAAVILERIQLAIEREASIHRLQLGSVVDKYAIPVDAGPPCAELLPVCHARCCRLRFALTTQDLDERVIRWDRGEPYLIAHAEGRCSHNDAAGGCTVYAHRPAACRSYDCRADPRIWVDFDRRIPAPMTALDRDPRPIEPGHLADRARARRLALAVEARALREPPGPDRSAPDRIDRERLGSE